MSVNGDALRTIDDVRRTCEEAGLTRLDGENAHPHAWVSPDRTIGVAISSMLNMSGIHLQRITRWGDDGSLDGTSEQLLTIYPYVRGGAALLRVTLRAATS